MTPASSQELNGYVPIELLSVEPLMDAATNEPRIGLTISDGTAMLGLCLSLNDASMLLRQTREAVAAFAAGGDYPDVE